MATARLGDVLDATYECVTLYGVARTTMDDIARRANLSRTGLYQYVRGKDDAVRRLAARLHDRAYAAAEDALSLDAPADQALGILTAKLDLFLALAGDSPHGAELLDAKTRLFGDVCEEFTARLRQLLTDVFAHCRTAVPAADAAGICLTLVRGFEAAPENARLFRPAVVALLDGLL